MDPGIVPPELMVSNECCILAVYQLFYLKGLSEVEEMLISPVISLMSIYRLPRGQYRYSGHVINLPQDIPLFVSM